VDLCRKREAVLIGQLRMRRDGNAMEPEDLLEGATMLSVLRNFDAVNNWANFYQRSIDGTIRNTIEKRGNLSVGELDVCTKAAVYGVLVNLVKAEHDRCPAGEAIDWDSVTEEGLIEYVQRLSAEASDWTRMCSDLSRQKDILQERVISLQAEVKRLKEQRDQNRLIADQPRSETQVPESKPGSTNSIRSANSFKKSEPRRSAAPPVSQPAPVAVAKPTDEEVQIGQAFRSWCGKGGPMISRVTMFGSFLQDVVPGVQVKAVNRDMDSPAEPIELHERSVVSPAEYWLISTGSRYWLLPQPQSSAHFRELAPCFEGDASPGSVRSIFPAAVRLRGGAFVLDRSGRIS
jgi:hypothetical protein